MQIAQTILKRLRRSPLRTVVVDDRRSWRGIDMYVGALHLAKAVDQTTSRENIGIMLPTSGSFPMAMLASWMLGRTIVPISYLLAQDEKEHVIEDAGLDTVITATKLLELTGPLPDHIKQLKLDEMKFGGVPRFRRCARRPEDHIAVLLYTSGTSGKPKGVMLSSGNLMANINQVRRFIDLNRDDVLMSVLPQFHSSGFTVLTLLPMHIGAKTVYTARFVLAKILKLFREHRPSLFFAIPSMYNALLRSKNATVEDLASLRFVVSGGEPLPKVVADNFRERFKQTIKEGYGLTETAPAANWLRPTEDRPGSVGRALPDVIEKVVDPTGAALPVGEEGEICIKGPNVMKGYYNLPEATAAVFDEEGYFKSGDMGRLDEDGFLYITGRIKEMLIIGGENVFPREIEEVLNQHPDVHDSAVIGMQDANRGEVALAFVELAEGATFNEMQLRSHCRESLAQFKVPRDIRVLDELPRNPTGKIMRRRLNADIPSAV